MAESRRSSTLAVAKKVNHYQSKIKETTRKMMALVSELSMQQVGLSRTNLGNHMSKRVMVTVTSYNAFTHQ